MLGAEALTGSIDQRIDELEKVVSPNQANWKGSGGNSLGVVSSVGKGLKNATKSAFQSTAEPAKSVLKSPTFWMLLIGAGALPGLYFATRNSGGGGAVPASYYPDPIYGCHGAVPCHVCTDCSRCIHCNSGRSQCLPARSR